jgi:DNA polymerase-3 subunit delta
MAKQLSEYKPVYLIIAEQDLLLNQAVDSLKASVAEVADLDFNLETFEGESISADDVVAACNTLPFVSERRLVIVRGIDKLSKDAAETLVRYAGDPSPTTILALVGKKLAKNTRLYKAVDKLGGVIERKTPDAREFPRLVQDMFVREGKRISAEGAEYLVNAVGRDMQRLSVEVGKTVSYVGDRQRAGKPRLRCRAPVARAARRRRRIGVRPARPRAQAAARPVVGPRANRPRRGFAG